MSSIKRNGGENPKATGLLIIGYAKRAKLSPLKGHYKYTKLSVIYQNQEEDGHYSGISTWDGTIPLINNEVVTETQVKYFQYGTNNLVSQMPLQCNQRQHQEVISFH